MPEGNNTQDNSTKSVVTKVCTNCERDFGVMEEEVTCPDCGTATLQDQ